MRAAASAAAAAAAHTAIPLTPSLPPSLLPLAHTQIASERKQAQDSLHEAITALTAARSTVAALEAEAKDTSPRDGE